MKVGEVPERLVKPAMSRLHNHDNPESGNDPGNVTLPTSGKVNPNSPELT